MTKVRIGLIGYGVVGRGFVAAIKKNRAVIYDKTGIELELSAVADLNIASSYDQFLEDVPFKTRDAEELVTSPNIDIVVELIGGYTVAKEFITKAIANKKYVVTANKALLAQFGREIFSQADEAGVGVGFEASCGGGIPLISVLKEDLAANNILEVCAIINGTANFILTRMTYEGATYETALAEAKTLGYAEADPTFDVEGIDSAHKITLLSSIAFGTWVDFKKVYTEGITKISTVDINFAKELGCTIKLLAIGKRTEKGIDVRVHPTIISLKHRLAAVNDSFNAVLVKGDIVGETFHLGRGAGSLPTGSAVAADVIKLSKEIVNRTAPRIPPLGFLSPKELNLTDIKDVESEYYLRFETEDTPGVLSGVAGVLAKNSVSIKSALQRPYENELQIPMVFLTHTTTGRQIDDCLKEIIRFPFIKGEPVAIRVEEEG
ncbi:MAG: homoserine dehydrogenase [Deferribacteraceae bacterium]|jgi:homoserine dehydrogenase|nr:homoserine dehydrogenase [Deferribacteraceae bacterium]